MKQIVHKTGTYERWDTLAYKYLGDVFRYPEIVAANPSIPISPFLPAFTNIIVPIPDTPESTSSKGLPPWKQ